MTAPLLPLSPPYSSPREACRGPTQGGMARAHTGHLLAESPGEAYLTPASASASMKQTPQMPACRLLCKLGVKAYVKPFIGADVNPTLHPVRGLGPG